MFGIEGGNNSPQLQPHIQIHDDENCTEVWLYTCKRTHTINNHTQCSLTLHRWHRIHSNIPWNDTNNTIDGEFDCYSNNLTLCMVDEARNQKKRRGIGIDLIFGGYVCARVSFSFSLTMLGIIVNACRRMYFPSQLYVKETHSNIKSPPQTTNTLSSPHHTTDRAKSNEWNSKWKQRRAINKRKILSICILYYYIRRSTRRMKK